MSVASPAYYPAVAVVQQIYLTRLILVESYPAFHWDALVSCVPQVVNDALMTLDDALLKSLSGITVYSGKAVIRDRVLSVYHAYSDKIDKSDTVVVGLSIERSGTSVTIRGDVVGEETGSVFFELINVSCVGDNARVLEEIKNAAKQLASQPDIVAQAIMKL